MTKIHQLEKQRLIKEAHKLIDRLEANLKKIARSIQQKKAA